jgi:hypothetical protein
MKVTIEEYRGFEIYFDTDHEVFQCVVADESAKESKSFSAVKKFVDDYKKDNQDFAPFWVDRNPERYYTETRALKIIGLRKDGRFIAEKNGGRIQVSDHDLSIYVVSLKENERFFTLLSEFESKKEQQRLKNIQEKKRIIAGMKITTLKDYKKNLLS